MLSTDTLQVDQHLVFIRCEFGALLGGRGAGSVFLARGEQTSPLWASVWGRDQTRDVAGASLDGN
jgi:hypothetical protein